MKLPYTRLSQQRRARCIEALMGVLIGLSWTYAADAQESEESNRLPREHLLTYRTAKGEIAEGKTISEWMLRKYSILTSMEAVMGKMPGDEKRCALDPVVETEVDAGSYIRIKLTYQSEPGSRVPAYLCVPKRALQPGAKAPAALCLHPTDDQVGNKVVVGLGGRAGRQYAAELAERGWVTLAPAYPLLADYQPDLKALDYSSGTMKAIWDNRRGLDLLESYPFVKSDGFAAIGHSLGGHNAIFTAVWDERIRVIVSSCGFDSFLDYKGGDIRGWTGERYMPNLLNYTLEQIPFDFHELLGCLAPRAVFICAPIHDSNFSYQSVQRVVQSAQAVYRLWNQEQAIKATYPEVDHQFPQPSRAYAYLFMDTYLSR